MTCLLTNKIYTGSTESNTHRHSKHNKAIYIGYNIIVIERRMSWRYNIGTWGERERERGAHGGKGFGGGAGMAAS